MRVKVSGAAGCAAYIEGENLHFIHLASPEGWRTAALNEMQHVFLQASDITEIEVASREEAEARAILKTDVTHALRLMELVLASKLPEVARLSASYVEGWLDNRAVRSEIEKYFSPLRYLITLMQISSYPAQPHRKPGRSFRKLSLLKRVSGRLMSFWIFISQG